VPVVQPIPGAPAAASAPVDDGLLDAIDPALLDQLIASATPKFDTPVSSQRSLSRVGVIDEQDGGFPATSTHFLNGAFVEGVIGRMSGDLVSRWGHILVRRALASRLDTPVGMNGADWAALRAQALLRMGEADAARAMVQEVDSGFYTPGLEDAAMGSYLGTADPVGLCPITGLTAAGRQGWDWDLARAICSAFTGDGPPAMAQLDRAMRRGDGEKIDILLAQKFAGAASNTRRAVTIEWKDVTTLTPWRTGISLATGLEPPKTCAPRRGPPISSMPFARPCSRLPRARPRPTSAPGEASCRARRWSISMARSPRRKIRTRPGGRSPTSCVPPTSRPMRMIDWARSRNCGAMAAILIAPIPALC
jgi:hypothetical protein